MPGKLLHTLGVYLAKQTLIVLPGERQWAVKQDLVEERNLRKCFTDAQLATHA